MRFGTQLRAAILASKQLNSLVDRSLRRNVQEMAYLAMQTARGRIVVRNATGRHKKAWRTTKLPVRVRTLINRTPGGRPSTPGESPTNQFKVLKHSIVYEWARGAGQPIESIVGAKSLTGHKRFTEGLATRALEHGGMSRNWSGRLVQIKARPFMAPSNPVVMAHLAQIWANSIPAGRVMSAIHFQGS